MAFEYVGKNYKHIFDNQRECEAILDYTDTDRKILKYKYASADYEFVIDDYRNGCCKLFIPKNLKDEDFFNIHLALTKFEFDKEVSFSFIEEDK